MSKFNLKDIDEYSDEEKIRAFNHIYKNVSSYIDFVKSDEFYEDNDYKHYIYEAAVSTIAGKDFWDFYNNKVSWG